MRLLIDYAIGDLPMIRQVRWRRFAILEIGLPLAVSLAVSLLIGTPVTAQPQTSSATEAPAIAELDRRSGEGEQCIVCDQAIQGDEIIEVRYKGRSFYVAAVMLGELEDDPDQFFKKLQARSALFDERSMEGRAMSTGWLLFGVYVLVGLVCAAICGYLAINRSLAPIPWFFAGLLGNIAALAVLLATPRAASSPLPAGIPAGLAKVPLTHAPIPCGHCATTNHPAASSCSGCGNALKPTFEPETVRV